ncbi:hypothetical protein [Ornithinimicrobium avium]|uniref:Uncharacterized protein n=1 Tax=Ornithinimicrobium avium TaxID=2283195 RepID=A0A345NL61_9MICO|nr:hypothetical protein [Ornithinimicrobium avium]AXH95769.1 hypothetical protein DV701_06175 [Ornithinimicrobium avium]
MDRTRIAVPLLGVFAAVLLSGCIAGEVPERGGGIGVSVDAQERAVVVVHACEPAPLTVSLALGREGLAPGETNEAVGAWTASAPVAATTELALHDPGAGWEGDPVELLGARSYVADGSVGGQGSLGTVAFRYADLARMEPGSVYVNGTDPDAVEMVRLSVEEFASRACPS